VYHLVLIRPSVSFSSQNSGLPKEKKNQEDVENSLKNKLSKLREIFHFQLKLEILKQKTFFPVYSTETRYITNLVLVFIYKSTKHM